jgi:hypothetical protein
VVFGAEERGEGDDVCQIYLKAAGNLELTHMVYTSLPASLITS